MNPNMQWWEDPEFFDVEPPEPEDVYCGECGSTRSMVEADARALQVTDPICCEVAL